MINHKVNLMIEYCIALFIRRPIANTRELAKLNKKLTIKVSNGFQLRSSVIQGIPSIELTNIPRAYYNQITEWGMLLRIANKIHDIQTAHIPKEQAREVIPELMSKLNCTIKRVI